MLDVDSAHNDTITKTPIRMQKDPGQGGSSSVKKLELQMRYLSNLKLKNGTESSAPSGRPYKNEAYLQRATQGSSLEHDMPPWIMWHRPSGQWTGLSHDVTTLRTFRSFYKGNAMIISTPTPVKSNRKQSHLISFKY
jgi:hypothetical protein